MWNVLLYCMEEDGVVLGVIRILVVWTVVLIVIDAAPNISIGCRGTVSRACATERPREWSTPYSRRIVSDT